MAALRSVDAAALLSPVRLPRMEINEETMRLTPAVEEMCDLDEGAFGPLDEKLVASGKRLFLNHAKEFMKGRLPDQAESEVVSWVGDIRFHRVAVPVGCRLAGLSSTCGRDVWIFMVEGALNTDKDPTRLVAHEIAHCIVRRAYAARWDGEEEEEAGVVSPLREPAFAILIDGELRSCEAGLVLEDETGSPPDEARAFCAQESDPVPVDGWD